MRYKYIYRGNTEDYEQMFGRAALEYSRHPMNDIHEFYDVHDQANKKIGWVAAPQGLTGAELDDYTDKNMLVEGSD